MKKEIGLIGTMALLLLVVFASGCTSQPVETESNVVAPAPATVEAASDCPICGLTGEYGSETDTYACSPCKIVWIADRENKEKVYSTYADYVDDYEITMDELETVPWNA